MAITNMQEWSATIEQVVGLLAECNKFQIAEGRKEFPSNYAGLEDNTKRLIDYVAENADACGLFEMVAEKIQSK